ncbi:hypothetical protein FC652_08755 [Vibrio sp. 05-20-BW147]|uniref:hypothetical protein n=1 Tax=Vibrio sp. 05-20-BW147 TaxID=2575834 RepID=UPI001594BBC2|nr:hypothetical protein [Vibrio sp. 05-20-BW147]NVC63218.1 hypothetical protein [Vibrio sp. 05-20-BW147]
MILAIASGGGHFVQLRKITERLEFDEITFFSTIEEPRFKSKPPYKKIPDCNLKSFIPLVICFVTLFIEIVKLKPKVIISTGAAPGFLALLIGRCLGAKTIWIDSIANSEELSLAGKKAKWVADHWYTQWEHLATDNGPFYIGAVL